MDGFVELGAIPHGGPRWAVNALSGEPAEAAIGGGHAAIGDASPLQQERLELLLSERVLLHMGPDHLACR